MTHISSQKAPRLKLRVRRSAETYLKQGHPWVYSDSVQDQNREGEAGELAVLYDRQDRFMAIGLYDPASPIRVRIVHLGAPRMLDREWWAGRLAEALARREGLFGPDTDGYRLINGESDGWPGLVLDRYGSTLVVKLYTAAWFAHWDLVVDLLAERFPDESLVLRLSRNIQEGAARLGLHDGQVVRGDVPDGPVVFHESGLAFEADVLKGQKTGFFLDQRENRRRVEAASRGARVLNAFSFSGGFSLYAARGGARSVTSLDISAHALASAERNFALNADDPAVAACAHEPVQADVFTWLAEQTSRRFDVIVLDPPSLARREDERSRAIRKYQRLAEDALRLLEPGGLLLAASCSAHVNAEEFYGAVQEAVHDAGRDARVLRTAEHAPDHPATFAEARYLKAIYLRCP